MTPGAVLLDIEGTVSSLSFVRDTLFPYARARLPGFITDHQHDPEVASWLAQAAALGGLTPGEGPAPIVALLQTWIDEDRKATPLKALQGLVWAEGYADGTLRGHLYDDAVAALYRWHHQGLALYIYSSGSVTAQRLLFRHSDAGNLEPLFRGFFDTTVGAKRERASYERIVQAIGEDASGVHFLSDITAELDAARGAGMQGTLVAREGAIPSGAIRSLLELPW